MPTQKAEIVVLTGRYKVHHFRSLESHFDGRYVYEESFDPRSVLGHMPALVITFDEHYCELANVIGAARESRDRDLAGDGRHPRMEADVGLHAA